MIKPPSDEEIEKVMDQCERHMPVWSAFPSRSYEEGVEAGIAWLREGAGNPLDKPTPRTP